MLDANRSQAAKAMVGLIRDCQAVIGKVGLLEVPHEPVRHAVR